MPVFRTDSLGLDNQLVCSSLWKMASPVLALLSYLEFFVVDASGFLPMQFSVLTVVTLV